MARNSRLAGRGSPRNTRHTLELLREANALAAFEVTEEQAQEHIIEFLRDHPEHMCGEWRVLNCLSSQGSRQENRAYAKFYLAQLGVLVRSGKVVRYRKGFMRGKIRLNQGLV